VCEVSDNGKIRVLLADDHKSMRDGLKALCKEQSDIEIVGEIGSSEAIELMTQEVRPDIITIGININGTGDIEIAKKLAREFPEIKIIAHSMYLEKTFVSEMLKAGISAYVHKEHSFSELLNAINAAVHNEVYLCPKVASVVMNGYLKDLSQKGGNSEVSLTDREREVLKLLANGESSKQIAMKLHISTKTVDTHRRQMMNKLNLYSVQELTKYAIRCGLTSIN
jgi:DNA-binding NarL/FixJ family response regulator